MYVDIENSQNLKSTTWEDDLEAATKEIFVSMWKVDLMRTCSKRGEAGNKLRTYNLFKSAFEYEPYLTVVGNRDKRVLLTKFRIGICPLRIETGRYEIIGSHKGVIASERVCLVCGGAEVEDEYHFLLKCPVYNHTRLHMLNTVKETCKISDSQLEGTIHDPSQLFASIMKSKDRQVINSVADYIWDAYLIREKALLDRHR